MQKSMYGDVLDSYFDEITDQIYELNVKFECKKITKEEYEKKLKFLEFERQRIYEAQENQIFSFRLFKDYESDLEVNLNGIIYAEQKWKQKGLTPEEKILKKQLDFRRLAEKRMQKLIKNLRSIKNLFNKSHYNYENSWIQEMQVALQTELNALFDIPGYKIVAKKPDAKDPDFIVELERFKGEMIKKNIALELKIKKLEEKENDSIKKKKT